MGKESHHKMPDLVQSGEIVGGKYMIVKKLNSGSFGQVYKATVKENGDTKNVALKVESMKAKKLVLQTEGEILRKLGAIKDPETGAGSDFVITCFDMGAREGIFSFIAIELSKLGSLRDYFQNHSSINSLKCSLIMIQGLSALRFIHKAGFVHRDIKPGNMIIKLENPNDENSLKIKLIDFGLARRYLEPDGSLRRKRNDGQVSFRGTKMYCSANILKKKEYTRQCDCIGLGYSLLPQVVTRKLPWNGSEIVDVLIEKREKFILQDHLSKKTRLYKPFHTILSECYDADYEKRPDYEQMMSDFQYVINQYIPPNTMPKEKEQKVMKEDQQPLHKSFKNNGWLSVLNKFNGLNMVTSCGKKRI